jgi:hypothetical protein
MGHTRANGTDRTADGRFAPGNSGGPGRPPRQTEREYLRAMMAACTPEDWEEIVERTVQDAKEGDPKAREWLARYLVGMPTVLTPMPSELAVEDEVGHDPLRRAAEHLAQFGQHLPRGLW